MNDYKITLTFPQDGVDPQYAYAQLMGWLRGVQPYSGSSYTVSVEGFIPQPDAAQEAA